MLFFFANQKTAYESRISDCISCVCSSYLVTSYRGTGFWKAWLALEPRRPLDARIVRAAKTIDRLIEAGPVRLADAARESDLSLGRFRHLFTAEIGKNGRAAGRERGCQYV